MYVRVELFDSAAEATARLAGFMEPYATDGGDLMIGSTSARYGWAADRSSYARGWTSDNAMTLVKASFSEWTPEHTFEIIERQGVAVSEAVEIFQRTGLEGVSAQ